MIVGVGQAREVDEERPDPMARPFQE